VKSDAKLLRAARKDPAAFRQLYDRYAEAIHAYHLRRSKNVEVAGDLTAETFAQAWFSRERFSDQANGSAAPWLYGIARHVLLASVREQQLERAACERLGISERLDTLPGTVAPEESWLEGLDEMLEELPPGQREALRLRFDEDLDYEGVASALNTSPTAARIRVSRGLASLRRRITKMEVNP
jgi:RNA polymerase sigma-70 factor (ECF subfamily)